MLIHSVYFWLNEDTSDAQRDEFAGGISKLLEIDLIAGGQTGVPASTESRPVTDHSWDFSIVLEFPDQAAHDAYQVHPGHDVFVNQFKDLWAEVLVLDTQTS